MKRDKANDDAIANVKKQEDLLKQMEDVVDAATYSSITTCDAKTGVSVKVYDVIDCKGDVQETFAAKWGECKKWGSNYYKVTGAAALQAAAVAVVAFAGSQF